MAGDDSRAQVQLDEDTLARRRVLGEDHPDTLASADNLAISLQAFREQHQAARELGEDTLARRRVLGDGHLDTMASASFTLILSGLAADPKARAAMETLKAAWSEHGEGRQPDS